MPKPIAEGLFEEGPGGPALIGGRRLSDGKVVFPMPGGAESARYEPVRLNPRGKLWSWTVQRFRPKSPPYAGPDDEMSFKPFALGYVELEGQVIVESRIEVEDFADLRIGMPLELTLAPFGPDTVTYAFRPAGAAP